MKCGAKQVYKVALQSSLVGPEEAPYAKPTDALPDLWLPALAQIVSD